MRAESRASSSRHPGFFRWVMGLLVFTSALVTAESANASCGDYLHGFNQPSLVDDQLNEEHLPVEDVPSKSPFCNGPFCQQVPIVPTDRPQPETRTSEVKVLHPCDTTVVVFTDEWSRLEQDRDMLPNPPDLERLDRPPRR
jgi:hypothetical protein